jgi:glycosyltransferase involved in cell wall biosynthesis
MGYFIRECPVKKEKFDVSYLTIDSIQEGVGSSQVTPLILGLATLGQKISLITFEKKLPPQELIEKFQSAGVTWVPLNFGNFGALAGFKRLNQLRQSIPDAKVLHGRSDIPTASAVLNVGHPPTLWDVRSLWSDQRKLIGTAGWNPLTAKIAKGLENVSAKRSMAMTTLTAAVVPVLETRHSRLPAIREVIPTCVQTDKFQKSNMPSGQYVCLLSGTFNNYYDIERTREIIHALKSQIDLKVIWARAAESPGTALYVGEDLIVGANHSEMPALVKSAHFGLAICREDEPDSLSAAVPTKIGEFLASGRPMILSRGIGDMDSYLKEFDAGLIVGKADPLSDLGDRILELLSNSATVSECRQLAEKYFSMNEAIKKYLDIYSRMEA